VSFPFVRGQPLSIHVSDYQPTAVGEPAGTCGVSCVVCGGPLMIIYDMVIAHYEAHDSRVLISVVFF